MIGECYVNVVMDGEAQEYEAGKYQTGMSDSTSVKAIGAPRVGNGELGLFETPMVPWRGRGVLVRSLPT
jgi:hypothetical protein